MEKKNCWEFKKCGRGPQGNRVSELGICAAATERTLDGSHGGHNAGRACWVVAGTLCGDKVQGTFAKKFGTCEACEFYLSVKKEEITMFILSGELLRKLRRMNEISRIGQTLYA